MPLKFQPRNEPVVMLAISDTEVIVSIVIGNIKSIHILNIETPLPFDVLAWINLLRREDGGVGTR